MKNRNRLPITDNLPRLSRTRLGLAREVKAGRLPHLGFTLVEIIVATAISAFFLIMVASIFTRIIQDSQRVLALTNLQKTADQTLLNLTQEARWAKNVSAISSDSLEFQTDIQCIRYRYISSTKSLEKYTANLKSTGTDCSVPGDIKDVTTENLNPPSIKVTSFNIINRSSSLDRPSFDITLILSTQDNNFVYSNHTAITPRNKFPGAI